LQDLQSQGESARIRVFQQTLEVLSDIQEREDELVRKETEETEKIATASALKLKSLEEEMSIQMAKSKAATENQLREISLENELQKKHLEKELENKLQQYSRDAENIRSRHKAKQDELVGDHEMEIKRMKAELEAKLLEEKRKQDQLRQSGGRIRRPFISGELSKIPHNINLKGNGYEPFTGTTEEAEASVDEHLPGANYVRHSRKKTIMCVLAVVGTTLIAKIFWVLVK